MPPQEPCLFMACSSSRPSSPSRQTPGGYLTRKTVGSTLTVTSLWVDSGKISLEEEEREKNLCAEELPGCSGIHRHLLNFRVPTLKSWHQGQAHFSMSHFRTRRQMTNGHKTVQKAKNERRLQHPEKLRDCGESRSIKRTEK